MVGIGGQASGRRADVVIVGAGLAGLMAARRLTETGIPLLVLGWAEEEYIRGGYAGYMPPGVWTAYGAALREPIGPLHWAGTETATVWNGYMDGALQSGERAAVEVAADLGVSLATGDGGQQVMPRAQ
jgi:monoamine oxidase